MGSRRGLTVTQEERCRAFANVHRAYSAVKETRLPELDEMRRAALLACLEVGVPNTAMAEMSGLSNARIHQLVKSAGGKPELHRRMVPET